MNTGERRLDLDGIPIVVRTPSDWCRGMAVILAHGAGRGMDSPFMTFFHEGLAALGYLSVKFNFPYMEAGRRLPDPQQKLRDTYRRVIGQVEGEFDPGVLAIGGKSLGGRVGSYIGGALEGIRGLIFLGYPLHPPGRPDRMRDEHLYALDKPMLFLSGTRDTLAGRELLDGVVRRIGAHARIAWVEGGDHSLKTGKKGPDRLPEALAEIDRWMQLEFGRR